MATWVKILDLATAGSGSGGGGPPGRPGRNGNRWTSGDGPPSRRLGNADDYYFQRDTGDVWCKQGVVGPLFPRWKAICNLKGGPPGGPGPRGPRGFRGLMGAQGPQGPQGNDSSSSIIGTQTLGANTATVTFASIVQNYSHLRLIFLGRNAGANTSANVLMQFNSDTGNNYTRQILQSHTTTVASSGVTAQSSLQAGDATGANISAGPCGAIECMILGYSQTTFHKTMIVNGQLTVSDSPFNERMVGTWQSTSAITQIDLTINGGSNWLAGSIFTLYGIP